MESDFRYGVLIVIPKLYVVVLYKSGNGHTYLLALVPLQVLQGLTERVLSHMRFYKMVAQSSIISQCPSESDVGISKTSMIPYWLTVV